MKNSLWFVASVALFLASCSTGNKMQSSATTDDLYVAKTESYVAPATDQVNSNDEYQSNSSTESDEVTSEKYSDESGNTYITNNYYDNNSYTSQLDRWYNPGLGFGYFNPFYTGYSFYDPFHYSPGFSISIGFNQGWGHNWYNPYYPPCTLTIHGILTIIHGIRLAIHTILTAMVTILMDMDIVMDIMIAMGADTRLEIVIADHAGQLAAIPRVLVMEDSINPQTVLRNSMESQLALLPWNQT